MRRNIRKSDRFGIAKRNTAKVKLEISLFPGQKERVLFLFFIVSFISSYSQANNKEKTSPRVKFSGFIKYELFADTRQTVNAREGLVVFYPEDVLYDVNGNYVNAANSINMLSIHSRLRCSITGPVLLGAQSSGLVEADFYGNENKKF